MGNTLLSSTILIIFLLAATFSFLLVYVQNVLVNLRNTLLFMKSMKSVLKKTVSLDERNSCIYICK